MIDFLRLHELLNYNPMTGIFTWKISIPLPQGGWKVRAGDVAGGNTHGYCRIVIDQKRYYAHRLAWLYMTGEWPHSLIDHINRDGIDNRWTNLRQADKRGNAGNSKIKSDNSSGVRGVSFDKKSQKWAAQIGGKGCHKYLGKFPNINDAKLAYEQAAILHFGAFARAE